MEEELDKNSSHPGVAPIYFPTELARRELIEEDLEHFYGQDWREKMVVPKAAERYAHRLRQVLQLYSWSLQLTVHVYDSDQPIYKKQY